MVELQQEGSQVLTLCSFYLNCKLFLPPPPTMFNEKNFQLKATFLIKLVPMGVCDLDWNCSGGKVFMPPCPLLALSLPGLPPLRLFVKKRTKQMHLMKYLLWPQVKQ